MVLVSLRSSLVTAATLAGIPAGRRRRRAPLEAVLASGNPDELPRAAGLLGDLFVQRSDAGAAEHAYRAAIDAAHPHWSPVAQVALAQLLSDRGDRSEAQTLLKAAIASGNARTTRLAQASLDKLLAGDGNQAAIGPSPETYETLGDFIPTRRSRELGRTSSTMSVRTAVVAGVVGLAAGIAAMTVLISDLTAGTADSPTVEQQEPAAPAPHDNGYTGPTSPDPAEHKIRWLKRHENRIVRGYTEHLARGQMSMEEFEAIASTRVANGNWTPNIVDHILDTARMKSLAQLHQGCQVYSAGRIGTVPGCDVLRPSSAVDDATTDTGPNDPRPPRISERVNARHPQTIPQKRRRSTPTDLSRLR